MAGRIDGRNAGVSGASGCADDVLAFHHFRPDAAKAILKDTFDRRGAICIFEAGSGTLLPAATMFGVPLAVVALMPFSRPFRWAYLAFTYLIPLVPLACCGTAWYRYCAFTRPSR